MSAVAVKNAVYVLYQPAIAQLVEHLTVELGSDQMVPGSIPGGRTFFIHYARRSFRHSLKLIFGDMAFNSWELKAQQTRCLDWRKSTFI